MMSSLLIFGMLIAAWSMLGGLNIVSVKQLREKGRGYAKQMRALADKITAENRSFTDEERKAWDKLQTDYDTNKEQITALARARRMEEELEEPADDEDPDDEETREGDEDPDDEEEREGDDDKPADDKPADEEKKRKKRQRRAMGRGPGRSDVDGRFSNPPDASGRRGRPGLPEGEARERIEQRRALALAAWLRCNSARRLDPTDEQMRACRALRFNPHCGELSIRLAPHTQFARAQRAGWGGGYGRSFAGAEERALSGMTGSAGGLTISESMSGQLEINMLAYGGVLQAAETVRTANGEPFHWPTANDTSNSGRQIGESGAVTTLDPTFGRISWGAYKFTSDEILVPYELLEDSVFDLPSVIGAMLGERLGRILNTKFTTGTGAATARGIVTAASAGITTASSTAIAWDEITRLIHSIDPAYRQGAAFMFHDNVYLTLRLLKDADGRPLWADGPNSTPPATLQGYPYFINQDMASSVATGAVTMIFGQLNKYKVRQVNEVRMYRLIERHRENDQDAFLAFVRADGNLLEAGTAPVKKLTQV